MDLIKRDVREVITDVLTIRVSINSLSVKERKEMWDFVSQEISGLEKYVTKQQMMAVREIFRELSE